jgi:uncharacterized protein
MIQVERAAVIQPTTERNRLDSLDVIRGIALFGILFVNLTWFTGFAVLWGSGNAHFETIEIDGHLYWFINFLVDGKFWSIFAILFGIGIGLYFEKLTSSDSMFVLIRRLTVLLVVGLLHGILLWFGDIIALYAATGFFVLFFRNCSNRCLLLTSIFLMLLPLLHSALWLWIKYSFVSPDAAIEHPPHGPYDQLHYFESGNLLDVIRTNWPFFIQRWFLAVYEGRFFKLLGLFLLGVYFVRQGWVSESSKKDRQAVILFAATLLPAIILNYLHADFSTFGLAEKTIAGLWGSEAVETVGVPLMALSFFSLLILCVRFFVNSIIGRAFAAVGRMSLTNYLCQTVICMVLFYGFGFGLWGAFGISWTLLVIFALFFAQSIFSLIWLNNFRFGPLEWICRMLTYGKFLSLRKSKSAASH